MKKLQLSFTCIVLCMSLMVAAKSNAETTLSISSCYEHPEKINLLCGVVGSLSEYHRSVIDQLAHHLACKKQQRSGFSVSQVKFEAIPSRKEIRKLLDQGYPLVVFFSELNGALEWRLYDTTQSSMMLGKRVVAAGQDAHQSAEHIATGLWSSLLHETSLFGSRIAYCKEHKASSGKPVRSICIQSACGVEPETVHVDTPSIKCGLRWHPDPEKYALYYSECTASNVRLMSVDKMGRRSLFANLDGLTMQPSFSSDGLKMVMSSSFRGVSHIYYGERGALHEPWRFRRITKQGGNNLSPVFVDDDTIVLCSDFEGVRPHIYQYNISRGEYRRISSGLSSTSPTWCMKSGKLAYSKVIDGVIQLFVYDLATETHQQLTHDAGDKEESSWSPCGNYLAFSYDTGDSCRIAILNTVTNERWYMTPRGQRCTNPAWSPHFVA